ncbi:MAG: Hint domain-containing protein [Gemmobacter sp.]
MPLTYTGFFLGTGPIIDPTEGNTVAENAAALVGQTYGAPGAALVQNIVSITSVNIGGNPTALEQDNNVVNDRVTVNDGNGPVSYIFDAAVQYGVTLTYIDGTTANVVAVVFQTTDGRLYAVPSPAPGIPLNTALLAAPLRSMTINSVVGNNFLGLAIDRAALNFPTCFTLGTPIDTPQGPRPIETLRPGDRVLTRDNGARPIAWVGGSAYAARALWADPRLAPIRIRAGAIAPGVPQQDLWVSPQHRILLRSRIAARLAEAPEVLVAATHLAGSAGIARDLPAAGVEYWHILLDRHEFVTAAGLPSESLLVGAMAAAALGAAARAEIDAVFPGRIARGDDSPARPLVRPRLARALALRHAKHALPLLCA